MPRRSKRDKLTSFQEYHESKYGLGLGLGLELGLGLGYGKGEGSA